ncbi:MAG: hypothetical protein AAGC78_03135 [Cellvibrio sp.]|uniref:hypothetical protein n=1 Tax=Cellvibrio sp. TaxID=1965322 RepID=UPI0031B4735D
MLPFIQKKLQDNRLVVDGTLSAHGNARIKVEQDIAFLTDRIDAMKVHPRPNTMLIEHYQSMLKSRESVLKWLMDGCDDETTSISERSA